MNHIQVEEAVRRVLAAHGKLAVDAAAVDAKANLFDLGMDSQAVIRVMLGIEDELDISFPDEALTRDTFASIHAIMSALEGQPA